MKLAPYFELNKTRYEFKRTRWLIAEYKRLNEESPLSDEDRANAITASNLVADVKKFAEKENEWWDTFCENPTPETKATYFMFKEMSDEAIAKYNDFVSSNNTLQTATKHSIEILEKVAIKALAEQYFGFNEAAAKQIWDQFVDTMDDHNKVDEWLNAMAECLFGDDEEEDTGFLAQKRKMDEEKANNRKSAIRRKK